MSVSSLAASELYSLKLWSCGCAFRVIVVVGRLAWPHRRRGLASDSVRYAGARSSVGRRVRSATKLRLEWYGGVFLSLQQRSKHPRQMVITPQASTSRLGVELCSEGVVVCRDNLVDVDCQCFPQIVARGVVVATLRKVVHHATGNTQQQIKSSNPRGDARSASRSRRAV